MTTPKPAAPKPAAPKPPAKPAAPPARSPAELAGDSPRGTSNRALMLRRQLQNLDIDFQVPQGAKPFLHSEQMALIQQPTPKPYIKTRDSGGRTYAYVPIALTVERLNMIFCYGWSFKVTDKGIINDAAGLPIAVWVCGDLTITAVDGSLFMKSAFGGSDIETYKSGNKAGQPLSVANNFKSAESDAIGKAASMFGLWLDIYDKDGDILQERIAAAEQTEAALAQAATAGAGSRTVEGRARPVAGANAQLFGDGSSDGSESASADGAQAEADTAHEAGLLSGDGTFGTFELTTDDPNEREATNEAELLAAADEAAAAEAAETAETARQAAARAATQAAARTPAAAKPVAPKPPAKPTPPPAAPATHTREEVAAMSTAFFTAVTKMGWGLPGTPNKPNAALIEKVLRARDAGLWPLTVGNMTAAQAALQEEADKRRAARAPRPSVAGHV